MMLTKDKRGHVTLEYGLILATVGLAVGFVGSEVWTGIHSAMSRNGSEITRAAPASSAPSSQPCLAGAHPKSTACAGTASKL
jgi:Flp pilus assembly pilin Flp